MVVAGLVFKRGVEALADRIGNAALDGRTGDQAVGLVAPRAEGIGLSRRILVGVAHRDAHGAGIVLVDVADAAAHAVQLGILKPVAVAAQVHRNHALAPVQRADGLQVDGAGQALADHRGFRGLGNHHLLQQLRGVLVELHSAVHAHAHLLAAIERGGVEVPGQAADVDVGGAAAHALGGEPGQARQRIRNGHVRQLADVLRGHHFNDVGGSLLDVDGAFDRAADASDGHPVEILCVFGLLLGGRCCFRLFHLFRGLGGLRACVRGHHQRGRRQRDAQQVSLQLHHRPLQNLFEWRDGRLPPARPRKPHCQRECGDGNRARPTRGSAAYVFIAMQRPHGHREPPTTALEPSAPTFSRGCGSIIPRRNMARARAQRIPRAVLRRAIGAGMS